MYIAKGFSVKCVNSAGWHIHHSTGTIYTLNPPELNKGQVFTIDSHGNWWLKVS